MGLDGTYRGFSPTDESGVGLGEIEVVIDGDSIGFRFATGLTIESDSAPRTLLRELPAEEITSRFMEGADVTGVTGYQIGEDGPIFLFLREVPEVPEAARVLLLQFVSDEIDGIFGPTYLYAPDQVEAGWFDRSVTEIEAFQGDPGVIPKLVLNGLRG